MPSVFRLLRLLIRVLILGASHRKSMSKLRQSSDKLAAHNRMMDAYRRGDYESALKELESAKHNDNSYEFFRGSILMELGELEEAEKLLRKNALLEKRDHQSSIAYSSLGEVMQEQERFDEAMDCFQASLRHMPDRGSAHRNIAEVLLVQKKNRDEALMWAKTAVEKERASAPRSEEVKTVNLSENLAALAWATAATSHDRQAVNQLLAEAIAMVENGAVSVAARVHYSAGRAYAELGELSESVAKWEKASTLDPKGRWGRAARTQLAAARP
jgi:tetratricopeptide (TPR) repeat protein